MRWTDCLEIQAQMMAISLSPKAQEPFRATLAMAPLATATKPWANWKDAADNTAETFRLAQPFWIQSDMMDIAVTASTSMPRQAILPTDLPCHVGMCFFEKPVMAKSKTNETVAFVGFTWHAIQDVIAIIPWEDGNHDSLNSHRKIGWPFVPIDAYTERFGVDQSPDDERLPTMTLFWMVHRLPKALWALMSQRLTVVDTNQPERASRRRLAKGPKLAADAIKIVRLRKIDYARTDNETEVAWTHRWITNGHWRNQWYPSLNAHRLTWIAAHVKGPPGLPLIVKDTVNLLVR